LTRKLEEEGWTFKTNESKVDAADIASFGYNKTDITWDNFDLGDIMWLSPATGRPFRIIGWY